jgi:hypothetical protein
MTMTPEPAAVQEARRWWEANRGCYDSIPEAMATYAAAQRHELGTELSTKED